MTTSSDRTPDWRTEFSSDELDLIRRAAPIGIHAAQTRSARAHTEYQDPDDHLFVYGVGMAHGAPKDFAAQLKSASGYSEESVPRSSRKLIRMGGHVIHLHRVGARMPRNHRRLYLPNLSDTRRDTLAAASNERYSHTPESLFDLESEEHANLTEALEASGKTRRSMLLVPYYSSTKFGVGRMFLGPAVLAGKYLEITDPEPMTYRRTGATAPRQQSTDTREARRFASGERRPTTTKLRT
ncbi:hypothetical protein [Microbacterium sp. CJ88]|uniref:hypothetical protein n=1 Tax=Microbacterium sp. CJ88 TaxID=3445672 RepID=UPI003F65B106